MHSFFRVQRLGIIFGRIIQLHVLPFQAMIVLFRHVSVPTSRHGLMRRIFPPRILKFAAKF
jgi:hypothetical protein